MKNLLLIFATCFILFSCSKNDDDMQNVTTSFFNINTGNKWVYNRYNVNNSNNNSTVIQIDSVSVQGDTLINSISYKKIQHEVYDGNSNNLFDTYFEYLRIDNNDHLVSPGGFVLHPGFDSQYQDSKDYYSFNGQIDPNTGNNVQMFIGTATFQNIAPQNITVEGQNYFVYNYLGNFIGNVGSNIPNNTIHYMCEEGTGMVLRTMPYVSGTGYLEDRLVSYVIY